MGLDMYLTAKKYIGGKYAHRGITGKIEIYEQDAQYDRDNQTYVLKGKKKPLCVLKEMNQVTGIEFDAACWRKANAIHNWFVQECQEGKDECQTTWVKREQLQELVDICKQVFESLSDNSTEDLEYIAGWNKDGDIKETKKVFKDTDLAQSLLPPTSGFFFGSTDVDEWYKRDLKDTIDQLTEALDSDLFKDCEFYYHSSW